MQEGHPGVSTHHGVESDRASVLRVGHAPHRAVLCLSVRLTRRISRRTAVDMRLAYSKQQHKSITNNTVLATVRNGTVQRFVWQ